MEISKNNRITYEDLASALPRKPSEKGRFFYNGEFILCRTLYEANAVADFMQAIGVSDCCTTGTFGFDLEPQNEEDWGWSYVDC